MIKPEAFRSWLMAEYGVRLESCAWAREWESVITLIFECCEDLDRMALSPVGAVIYRIVTSCFHLLREASHRNWCIWVAAMVKPWADRSGETLAP